MNTLKKGSKGEAVKTLQTLLGITADGDFGSKTEASLKTFQSTHNLTPDGICGNNTWTALQSASAQHTNQSASAPTTLKRPCRATQPIDPSVVYLPLNVHITPKPNRPIKYLAIHFTAGSRSTAGTARNIKKVFEQRNASADFIVDDAEMVQCNPDPRNNYCWAVGDKPSTSEGGARLVAFANNANTISIEICSTLRQGYTAAYPNHEGWYFTDAALHNAARLAKIIMAKYNIPLSNVVRHYDISGKLCPGIIGWNNGTILTTQGKRTTQKSNSALWQAFLQRLQ